MRYLTLSAAKNIGFDPNVVKSLPKSSGVAQEREHVWNCESDWGRGWSFPDIKSLPPNEEAKRRLHFFEFNSKESLKNFTGFDLPISYSILTCYVVCSIKEFNVDNNGLNYIFYFGGGGSNFGLKPSFINCSKRITLFYEGTTLNLPISEELKKGEFDVILISWDGLTANFKMGNFPIVSVKLPKLNYRGIVLGKAWQHVSSPPGFEGRIVEFGLMSKAYSGIEMEEIYNQTRSEILG
ncbi:hypothetical protein [Labrys sp. (in: a-proteobacteria)]|uniref:hypothetical protein n=1 Tax=Labrys sp. (in: a-proteobacteria) TaxID=1917972 RepID=UPI0039E510EF